jgi:hypothetical protein
MRACWQHPCCCYCCCSLACSQQRLLRRLVLLENLHPVTFQLYVLWSLLARDERHRGWSVCDSTATPQMVTRCLLASLQRHQTTPWLGCQHPCGSSCTSTAVALQSSRQPIGSMQHAICADRSSCSYDALVSVYDLRSGWYSRLLYSCERNTTLVDAMISDLYLPYTTRVVPRAAEEAQRCG